MKLGFFNLSSAMLNLTQLINAGGYLGGSTSPRSRQEQRKRVGVRRRPQPHGSARKNLPQFQKYPVKQLELLADMAPWNSKTSRAQKINFRFPYILTCGLMGFMPFFDWGDKLANKFNFFPKDFLEEVIIEGSQKFFGEDAAKEVSRALLYGLGATANIDMSSRAGLAGFNMAGKRGRTNSVYDDFGSKLVRAFGFHSANESAISDDERIPQRKQTAQGIAHKAPTRERRNAKEKTYSRRAFLGQRSEERPPRLSIS